MHSWVAPMAAYARDGEMVEGVRAIACEALDGHDGACGLGDVDDT